MWEGKYRPSVCAAFGCLVEQTSMHCINLHLVARSIFFYYGKTWDGKKYPLAMWKLSFDMKKLLLFELPLPMFISQLFSNLWHKHCWLVLNLLIRMAKKSLSNGKFTFIPICKSIIFAISSFAIIDETTIEAFSFSLPLFSKMATRQPAFKLLGLSSMLRNFSSFRHKKAMM